MKKKNNSDFDCNGKDLKADLDTLSDYKNTVSETNGRLRSKIKEILDQKGYHSKALAVIRDFDKMSETELADVLRTFIPMFAAMRKFKWDDQIGDMLNKLDADE